MYHTFVIFPKTCIFAFGSNVALKGVIFVDDEFSVGDLRIEIEGRTINFYHNLTWIKRKAFNSPEDAKDAFEILKWTLVEYPKKWGDK